MGLKNRNKSRRKHERCTGKTWCRQVGLFNGYRDKRNILSSVSIELSSKTLSEKTKQHLFFPRYFHFGDIFRPHHNCLDRKETMFLNHFNIAIFQLDFSTITFTKCDFTSTSAFSHAYTFYVLFSVISAGKHLCYWAILRKRF